jgi:hypothetical protein
MNSASHNIKLFNSNTNKKSHLTINIPNNTINLENSNASLKINNTLNTINNIKDQTLKKCFSGLISDDFDDHIINPNFTSIMIYYNNITKSKNCKCKQSVIRDSVVFSPS